MSSGEVKTGSVGEREMSWTRPRTRRLRVEKFNLYNDKGWEEMRGCNKLCRSLTSGQEHVRTLIDAGLIDLFSL